MVAERHPVFSLVLDCNENTQVDMTETSTSPTMQQKLAKGVRVERSTEKEKEILQP